jgi:hypothetical protein
LRLPEFFYPFPIREKVKTLFWGGQSSEAGDWGVAERKQVGQSFELFLDKACGCKFQSFKPDALKFIHPEARKKVLRWFKENRELLNGFL